MTLIADVFAKLWIPKNVGRLLSKKSHFRRPFDKQHCKSDQTLLKSEQENLWHISWSIWRQLISKECLLVICKVLRLFVNTLTADDKYSVLNRDNLMQPIQILLSHKQKAFSEFFAVFLKYTLNFDHLKKKNYPHSWCISEIIDPKKGD